MKLLSVFWILLLSSPTMLLGQERKFEPHISLIGHVGGGWAGAGKWAFAITDETAPNRPGASFGLGLEYGPIARIQGTLLLSSMTSVNRMKEGGR